MTETLGIFSARIRVSMKKKILLIIAALTILTGVFSLYASKHFLQCSHYQIRDERIQEPFRIVFISDLHNSVFGKENEKLISKIRQQKPDLILITGDLINETQEDLSIAIHLIEALSQEFPVYVSLGNHEIGYQKRYDSDIVFLYEQAGAKVLEFAYEDIKVNGQSIRLGGIYGYCLAEKYESNATREGEREFLKDLQDSSLYTILMCHMPVTWIINNSLNEWDFDLVLCGHAHGGQIRIPFVGGLYAPDQGYFCGKEAGLYYSDDQEKMMLLTRGLGSTEKIPRLNNIPEIVVIDMRSK